MQKQYEDLFLGFSSALAGVDAAHSDVLESFGEVMAVCQGYLGELRALFDGMPPVSEAEEVCFFKSVKPRFYAERMLRFERYQLWVQRPVGTVGMLKGYLEGELEAVNRFFECYRFLYVYFKCGGSELDGVYFVRGKGLGLPMLGGGLDGDPVFSTAGDYLFAKFLALGRLREEILGELALLGGGAGMGVGGAAADAGVAERRLEWTGEVINLVELGYGLWLSGQLNGGKAGLLEIFRWLEGCFGLEIGIPANRFREIRRRKRLSRTHFMELCRERLVAYMDEDDVYRPGGKPDKKRAIGL